jgi:tRNA pseudouridine38-40 synthase
MTSTSPEQQRVQRYKIIVEYDGTRFNGFQRQSSPEDDASSPRFPKRRRLNTNGKAESASVTIQECLEEALMRYSNLPRSRLNFKFAGRTDAGVHAKMQVCAVDIPEQQQEWMIRKAVNSRLPSDISISSVSRCENDSFDPRHDSKRKQYSYTMKYRRKVFKDGTLLPICESGPNTIRSALDPPTIWVCPWVLDDSNIDSLCEKLTGTHDYTAFVHKSTRKERENILLVKLSCDRLEETKEECPVVTVRFRVESKGFRRSMVRNLVGFIVDICRGTVDESIFDCLWTGTDDVAAEVHSAPAFGLCLECVHY